MPRTLPRTPTSDELFPDGVPFDAGSDYGVRRAWSSARPSISPRRFRWVRVAVFSRDDWRCGDCGLAFPHDDPWVACGDTQPRIELDRVRVRVATSILRGDTWAWRPRYVGLDLHHVVSYLDGGAFRIDNLRALCSTCNSRRGERGDR